MSVADFILLAAEASIISTAKSYNNNKLFAQWNYEKILGDKFQVGRATLSDKSSFSQRKLNARP
jgi:hypothetical protein